MSAAAKTIQEHIPSCAYQLWQDGVCVASVYASTPERAWDEIWHYAMQYAEDGDVTIKAVDEGDLT